MAMKMIIPLESVDRRHSGPVFVGGTWTVRLKVGRSQGSRYAYLDPRAARRLACALLLQAEKVEMMKDLDYGFPKALSNTIDRAVDAVSRFHLKEEAFRKKTDDRKFQKSLKTK
jgi:hypothetical protein